ncbi:MAG: hypothetical protein AAGA75_05735 [Cyanobacteria bacterium P01_E01_bin.6]
MNQKENEEKIDWNTVEEFKLSEAVLLLLDRIPTEDEKKRVLFDDPKLPDNVKRLKKEILQDILNLPIPHSGIISVSSVLTESKVHRQELTDFAKRKGLQPCFLFQTNKTNIKAPISKKEEDIDPRRRRTYLTLIRALLNKLEIDPSQKKLVPKIKGFVELAGLRLDENTIRNVLQELKDMDED